MDYECEISLLRHKRKHVTLTIQEKLEIINLVESGSYSRQTIANRYGIGKSTVHDIHKRKDVLKNFAVQNSAEVAKRRRVDIKLENLSTEESILFKEEPNVIVEEETLVENFDHENFNYNDQEYEIVYEQTMCSNNETVDSKPVIPIKQEIENSAKRKSKTLTIKEKYDILLQLEEGKSVSAIINKYGIGRTTLYDLKKQKQKVIDYIENSSGETRRTFKKSNYPEIENNLINWCNLQENITEQEFFEKYKYLFGQLKSKNSDVQSPFTGSWSWCKRFFERHPEFKKKLKISVKQFNNSFKQDKYGESEKFYSESDSIIEDEPDLIKNTPNKKRLSYLNIFEKAHILDEVQAGKTISDLAIDYNISKSTVYDIIKKENEIRQQVIKTSNLSKHDYKLIQHPQIEKEIIDWCLEQDTIPSQISIANKALQLLESSDIKEELSSTTAWAKKFLERHSELIKQYDDSSTKRSESSICDIIEVADQDNSVETNQYESLELIEPEFLKSEPKLTVSDDYSNEYIIEELDDNNSNDYESHNYEEEQNETLNNEFIVTKEEALSSLKVLIKYSEQKGHDEISRLLLEYRDIIREENMI